MKIYIAGKVTGLSLIEVTHKFGQAHVALLDKGFTPVNPLEVVNDFKCPWHIAMRKCIAALMACDAVLLLPCWVDSKGARMELEVAMAVGLPVYSSINELVNQGQQPKTAVC
jgi:nucleoside 2-deoxyribosyltransferase